MAKRSSGAARSRACGRPASRFHVDMMAVPSASVLVLVRCIVWLAVVEFTRSNFVEWVRRRARGLRRSPAAEPAPRGRGAAYRVPLPAELSPRRFARSRRVVAAAGGRRATDVYRPWTHVGRIVQSCILCYASRGGGAWCAGASDASGRAAAKERPAKTRKPCGRLRRDGWKGCGRGVGALVWCGSRLREVTRMWYPPSAMCGRVEHCRTAMRVADRRRVSMSI